jgi:hypothetical protein
MDRLQAITEICDLIVEAAQRNIGATRTIRGKKRRRVSTGTLKDSLNYSADFGSAMVKIKFGAMGRAKQYADVIEQGRRKDRKPPPYDEIAKWIKEKPIKLRNSKGAFVKTSKEAIEAAAKRISWAISKRGIEGIYYYREAITSVMETHGDKFDAAILEMIKIKINNIKWQ